jgi:L-alanine-DL-glutamate epimerase-like enolase superfamily enzyme
MLISECHVYQYDLPVKGGTYRTSQSSVSVLDTTIVEIVTDTGLVGYGETCPLGSVYQPHHALGARSALQEIGPNLIGLDPLKIGCVHDAMDQTLSGHFYAKAAVDIALWDLCGKAWGVRVCDLLGGAKREDVPSYYAIDVVEPAEAASIASEKQAEGFRRLQIKVGGRDIELDIEAIRKVHENLKSGVTLAVDANRAWTTRDAMNVSLACRDISFIMEQPCATLEEIISLRRQIPHPIFLDENADGLSVVLRAVGERICDGFGLKVTRMGGLSAMRTIRDICHVVNLPITCDDAWGGDIIAAACTHIGATVKSSLLEGVWLAAPHIEGHYDPDNGVTIENGTISVPKGVGLGVMLNNRSCWGSPVMSFG